MVHLMIKPMVHPMINPMEHPIVKPNCIHKGKTDDTPNGDTGVIPGAKNNKLKLKYTKIHITSTRITGGNSRGM